MKKIRVSLIAATAFLCLAFLAAFLLPATRDAQAAGKKKGYITVQELYEQTRNGWQAEYTVPPHETYGGIPEDYAFSVDVEIEMPDVDKVPILDLVLNKDVFKDESIELMMEGQIREDGAIISNTMHGWDDKGEVWGIFFDPYYYPVRKNEQAENNPLSPEDAKTVFQKVVWKYFGKENVKVDVIAGSVATPVFPDNADPDEHRFYPALDKGVYWLEGSQHFEGIPLIATGNSWKRYFPLIDFSMQVMDDATYRLEGTSFNQTAIVHEDVPLLPWHEIQTTFEECLGQNRMYDVYSVRFGYQLTITRKGKNTGPAGYTGDRKTYPEGTFDEIYTTRPVWVIQGFEPKQTRGALVDEQIEGQKRSLENQEDWQKLFREFGGLGLIINAQTAELINYEDWDISDSDTVFPKILTWEDVKK